MKYYPAREVLDELMDKSLTPGRVIKATRARYKLTQKKLAEITGLKTTFISAVENDKRNLGVKCAEKLAVALGLHPTTILFPNDFEINTKELKAIERRRKAVLKKVS